MWIEIKLKFPSCFFYHSRDAPTVLNATSLIQKSITSSLPMTRCTTTSTISRLSWNRVRYRCPSMRKIYVQSDIESRRSPQKVLYQNIDSYYLQQWNDLKPTY